MQDLIDKVVYFKGKPGGNQSLQELMQFVEIQPCTIAQMRGCLNAFCIHLRTDLKASRTPEVGLLMYDIIYAVPGIGSLVTANFKAGDEHQDPARIECLAQFWPKIWSWLKYAHVSFTTSLGEYPGDDLRNDFRKMGLNFLRELMHVDEVKDKIIFPTEGLLDMIVQLWCMDIDDPLFALKVVQGQSPPAAGLLDSLLSNTGLGPDFWMKSIVEPAGGLRKFTHTAISHLRVDMAMKQSNLNKLIFDIRLVTLGSQHRRISSTFAYHHSVGEVTKHLVALVKRPTSDNHDTELVERAVECCLFNLVITMEGGGAPSIAEALDSHLLVGVLGCEPWITEISASAVSAIFSQILPIYLVYRSVLLAASRELVRVQKTSLEKKLSRAESPWKSWDQLKSIIQERLPNLDIEDPEDIHETCQNKKVCNNRPSYCKHGLLNTQRCFSAQEICSKRHSNCALDGKHVLRY